MKKNYEGAVFSFSLFNKDFLDNPFVRQTVMNPWFYLEAHVWDGNEFLSEMLMVSSFDALKDILELQHDSVRVQSIQYVTPGFLNGLGHWKMEPLIEVCETINQQGERDAIFRVSDRIYSHMGATTEGNLKSVKVLFSR